MGLPEIVAVTMAVNLRSRAVMGRIGHDQRSRGGLRRPRRRQGPATPAAAAARFDTGERHLVVHGVQPRKADKLARCADLHGPEAKAIAVKVVLEVENPAEACSTVSSGPRYFW